jgi:hypothetical protein
VDAWAWTPGLWARRPTPRLRCPTSPTPPRQVIAEAQKTLGKGDAMPTRRAADEMIYTLSVLKEALRK